MQLGVYDPRGLFRNATNLTYEHVFLNWSGYTPGTAYNAALGATNRGRTLLLTVLPFTDFALASSSATLLSDIAAGLYDATINALAADLASARVSVYFRWGPGMELPANRGVYDWATNDPNGYIAAYRYVVNRLKILLPSAFPATYIWSPDGAANAFLYYPLGDVVDIIGISAYSYAPYDTFVYGNPQAFSDIVSAKFNAAATADATKNVFVCEMGAAGVFGDFAYKNNWIANALSIASSFFTATSFLTGLIYFADSSLLPYGSFGNPNFICSPSVWTF
jgi:beta-mannanase